MASRKVTVEEAKRNLGELLAELASDKGELLIQQDADSVFVVLPLDAYDRKRLARERAAQTLEEMGRTANLDPEEADQLAEEAVRWARANKDK
ncbi:MAG: type II toxin-antitoxin system Phd/YefM family antitoxin [Chloroflexota bacterium]|nr:type II toxin-antitoxin system Phd/YefM family antitoxin [Chloroflexota bacterium]MDQ5867047.1 type II toxin-antitoxin system Phd/YefM family antitoxin [Chloroflexota bacterium]